MFLYITMIFIEFPLSQTYNDKICNTIKLSLLHHVCNIIIFLKVIENFYITERSNVSHPHGSKHIKYNILYCDKYK